MKEKIIVGVVSAMLSGGVTMLMTASNVAGRLTAVEKTLERIEGRLDRLSGSKP